MPRTLVYCGWPGGDPSPHIQGEVLVRAALTGRLYDEPLPTLYDVLLLLSPWAPKEVHHAAAQRVAALLPPGLKDPKAQKMLRQIARDRNQPTATPKTLLQTWLFPEGILRAVTEHDPRAPWWWIGRHGEAYRSPTWWLDVDGTAHAITPLDSLGAAWQGVNTAAYRDARRNLLGWEFRRPPGRPTRDKPEKTVVPGRGTDAEKVEEAEWDIPSEEDLTVSIERPMKTPEAKYIPPIDECPSPLPLLSLEDLARVRFDIAALHRVASSREREVLDLALTGLSHQDIADSLSITRATVDHLFSRLRKKFAKLA